MIPLLLGLGQGGNIMAGGDRGGLLPSQQPGSREKEPGINYVLQGDLLHPVRPYLLLSPFS